MLSIGANLSNLAYTQCSGSRDLEWRRKGWLCDCVLSSDTHVYLGLKLNATAKYNHGTKFVDEFNTVLFAIGRDAVHSQDLAGGCGRGAQPQEQEAAAQRAGAVRRGQHLCHRRRAGHHELCLRVHHGTGGQLKTAVTGY